MEVRLYFAYQAWKKKSRIQGLYHLKFLITFGCTAYRARFLIMTELQYSSQILKHLCDFPLPKCWFGYYSRLSAPMYAWPNIGEGKEHIWVRTKVGRVNVRNLGKIQEKQLLFQRFVTSIVDCGILAGYIRQGRPGFWGIQYIGVFNFRYTVFLCLKLGIKYSVTTTCCITYTMFFLILVFYTSFSIMFWYFGIPPPPPPPLPPWLTLIRYRL